jgi:periplasmic protein TonB
MFNETLLDSSPLRAPLLAHRHHVIAVVVGIAGQVALVGVLALIPLIYTEALPRASLIDVIVVPPPPPAAPPARGSQPIRPVGRTPEAKGPLTTPPRIPPMVALEDFDVPPEEPGPSPVGTVPGGVSGGTGVFPYRIVTAAPPPPPLPKEHAPRPKQIRLGGQVEAAKLIFQVKPEYPLLAKMARIQGTVRLEAVISTDGTIQHLRLLAGHPLLSKAVMDAVALWRYQPTLLNGEPVEVLTEIDVNFMLEQ